MKKIKNNLCAGMVLLSCVLFAQQKNVDFTKANFPTDAEGLKAAKKSISEGDVFFNDAENKYKQAIEPYLAAYKFNPNNAELNFKIGKCYLNSSYKPKSLMYLEKALALDPDVSPDLFYALGKSYQLNLEFDEAIAQYKKFQSVLQSTELRELQDKIEKRIEECNNGKKLILKPVRVKIDNVGDAVNSSYPEYGSLITADESQMMFTSKRNTTTGGEKDVFLNEYYEDVFSTSKKNGKWEPSTNIGKPINGNGHDATAGLSLDGQILYVYMGSNGGDLYESKLKGNTWGKPTKLEGDINTKYQESTASLSFDGKTLFFVSDRPDGTGGRDVYKVQKDKKGKWGKPENLGAPINTPYDEDGIFAHPDGKTIYFGSQGHNSMGGYDVFKSTLQNGKWTEPVNLGYPINTADDDLCFVISASGEHAYYSSVKPDTKGERDIYMITYLKEEKKDTTGGKKDTIKAAPTVQAILLKGVITDAKTGAPLEASIEIIDNQKNEVIANFNSNASSGKYLLSLPSGKNYAIVVKAEGYLFHSENFDIAASTSFLEIEKNVALNKLDAGSKIVLNNIFFDTDRADLKPESTNELERLIQVMNDNPKMKIQISGHTDNVGSAGHNQPLSEARAKSVVDYLIKNGIDKTRMIFKGFGFTQPVADNNTEEGRAKNRRTEFLIIQK